MTFRQFAFNNVFRNKRIYLAHFLSSSFSVMIFFTYALLLFHPDLQGELRSTSETMSRLGTMGMQISQYLIFIFSFFFLLYSVSAFLKIRKKEFGILLMLGMSPRQLNKLVFVENMMIGIASIISGVLIGLIFSKLILLISASVLYLDNGLPFYIPIEAIWTTAGAFFLLFLLISFFTSRMGKRLQIVELIRSEDKPKPEPKASVGLSILAVTCIGLGYGMVFLFVIKRVFNLPLLAGGVGFVVLGTYFLFTQLSVYVIRLLKSKERVFFKRLNLLTLSELSYRMKDNAIMFFMVAIVSAVAFTGMGTSLAIGNAGLAEMVNPYAFTYYSNQDNDLEEEHIRMIEQRLADAGYNYRMGAAQIRYTDNGYNFMRISDYNSLASALGYEAESVEEGEALLTPTSFTQRNEYKKAENVPDSIELEQGEMEVNLPIKKALSHVVMPNYWRLLVVTDALYDKLSMDKNSNPKLIVFSVDHWEKSKDVSKELLERLPEDPDGKYHFSALVFEWLSSKQQNGILLIVSVLVGIVFFTFAASFIYFRLYADLDRDERQYQMISKIGLSRSELRRMVTRQLLLMFFLPFVLALIHSGVAFIALQQLLDYSVAPGSITIFVSFLLVQIVYFFMIRWRYLQNLYNKLV